MMYIFSFMHVYLTSLYWAIRATREHFFGEHVNQYEVKGIYDNVSAIHVQQSRKYEIMSDVSR